MSLSSDNVGYLDISNAILRVGTLDVVGLQGVDTVTNVLRANSVLVYDDMGTDIATPPFTLGAGVSRSTSPTEIDLRYASGNNFMYKGIKLPNFFVGEFEVYSPDTATGNVFLQTYTESTTSYGNDGYELILDWQYNTITLKYDGTQITQGTSSGLTTATWQRISVVYDRNVWTVSVDGTVKLVFDDSERAAVYENPTTGQYLRFATNSGTSRKLRAIKFMNGSYWSQSKLGHLSYTNGNVGIGTYAPTTHRFEVYGSTKLLNVNATSLAISDTTESTSTTTGALTVAGGLGVAKHLWTQKLSTKGMLSVYSPPGLAADAPYQFTVSQWNGNGSDRWWRIGRLRADGTSSWSFIQASVTIQRVNGHAMTIDFNAWGVANVVDDFHISYVNVSGRDPSPYAARLIMYKDTVNHNLDIYIYAESYSRVMIKGSTSVSSAAEAAGLGFNPTPDWTTTAPTTSGTYTVFHDTDSGGSSNSLVQDGPKLGINIDRPDEALHVRGNIRLGARLGSDDNANRYISTAGQLQIRANDTSDTDPDYRYFNLVCGPTSNNSNTTAIQLGSFSDRTVRTYCENYVITKQSTTNGGQLMVYSNSGISSNVCVQGDGNIERTYTYNNVRYAGGMHLSGGTVLPLYDGSIDTQFRMNFGNDTYRWNGIYAKSANFFSTTAISATETMGTIGRVVSTATGVNNAKLDFTQVYEDGSQGGWFGWSQKISSVIDIHTHGGIRFNGYNNPYGVSIETGYSGGTSPDNLKTVMHFDRNGSVGIGTADPFNYGYATYSDYTLGGLHVYKDVYTNGNGYWCPNHTIQSNHQFYGKMYAYSPEYANGPYITSGMMIQNLSTSDIGSTGNYSQRLVFKTHDYGTYGGGFAECAMACSTSGKVSMRKYSYIAPLSKLHVQESAYANGPTMTVSGPQLGQQYNYSHMRIGNPHSTTSYDYCSLIENVDNYTNYYNSTLNFYTHSDASDVSQGGSIVLGLQIFKNRVGIGGGSNASYTCDIAGGFGTIQSGAFYIGNQSTVGVNYITYGNGDDATFTTYNVKFQIWNGLAFQDYGGIVNTVLNARTGNWYTNGTWTGSAQSSTSDDRVKDFEKPLHLGTDTLLKLNPQHYWKRNKLELTKVKYMEEFGLIAQDVYYDAPELRHLVKLHYDADPSPEKPVRDENIQIDPPYDDWGSQTASLNYQGLIPVMINSIKEIVTEKDAVKTRVTDVAFSNVLDHRGLIVCARDDGFSPKSGKPLVELSSRVACKAWYGVITGSNVHTEDSETLIARGGDAKVWVLMREGASVESGDLLCTSNVHGYAWTQSDDLVRSSTVAKLAQGCDFTVPVARPKKTIRRELRDVTYYIKRRWYPSTKEEYDTMPDTKRNTYLEDYYAKTDYEYRPKTDIKKQDDEEWSGVVYIKRLTYEISKETYDALSPEAREAYRPMEDSKFVRTEQQTATQEAYDLMTEDEREDYEEYQAKPDVTEKTVEEWEAMEDAEEKAKYVLKIRRVYKRMEEWVSKDPLITNTTVETKQEMVDVLDADGQHIYDDDPEATELPYEIRYLSAQGTITTRHNAVFHAALLRCTLMG